MESVCTSEPRRGWNWVWTCFTTSADIYPHVAIRGRVAIPLLKNPRDSREQKYGRRPGPRGTQEAERRGKSRIAWAGTYLSYVSKTSMSRTESGDIKGLQHRRHEVPIWKYRTDQGGQQDLARRQQDQGRQRVPREKRTMNLENLASCCRRDAWGD